MEYMILPPVLREKFTADEILEIQDAAVEDYSSDCHFFLDGDEKLAEMLQAGALTKAEALDLHAWMQNPTYVAKSPAGDKVGDFSLHPPTAILTGWVAFLAAGESEGKPWSDWAARGFHSPLEAMQTLGCLLTETRMDHHRGYRWTGPTGDYIIGGDINADLRIYRYPAGVTECHYGAIVSRVQPRDIVENIFGYHSTEGSLLSAVIAASRQTGFALESVTDDAAFQARAEQIMAGLHCSPPIFCPTGMSEMDAAMFAANSTWPLTPLGDKRCAHFIAREHGDPYTLHLDGTDIVACTRGVAGLRFPQAEWNQIVMGLFVQAARNGGRTPVGTLAATLKLANTGESWAEYDDNFKLWQQGKTEVF